MEIKKQEKNQFLERRNLGYVPRGGSSELAKYIKHNITNLNKIYGGDKGVCNKPYVTYLNDKNKSRMGIFDECAYNPKDSTNHLCSYHANDYENKLIDRIKAKENTTIKI